MKKLLLRHLEREAQAAYDRGYVIRWRKWINTPIFKYVRWRNTREQG